MNGCKVPHNRLPMSLVAAVFDIDGVIVKTNFVKHDAMLSLFAAYPEQQSAISEFILSNGGVPRKDKLTRLLRTILCVEPTEAQLLDYLRKYSTALESQLATAPSVEGVEEYIKLYSGPRYVCSSAPEEEVCEQTERRALIHHFDGIYGGTTPKSQALAAISAKHSSCSVVFFGDAVGDYEAACQAAVAFVGVVSERDNFQGMPVVKISDFANREVVKQAIQASVAQCGLTPRSS